MRISDEVAPSRPITQTAGRPSAAPLLMMIAIFAAALNLRPILSSLAPVLPEVIADTGITVAMASFLTMVPTLCLGIFGFLAPRLSARFGPEAVVTASLFLIAAGSLLRAIPAFPSLLAGTIAAGAAIGIVGVLIPSLVKREFSDRTGSLMSVYTMLLCGGAALGAGATVPLSSVLGGWPAALGFWAVPAAAAALVWVVLLRGVRRPAAHAARTAVNLWRSRLAWQVTLYMGLQSSLAYMVFGWLAPILRSRGFDPVEAGLIVSGSIMIQIIGALGAPLVAARRPAQSLPILVVTAMTLVGALGCLYAPPPLVIVSAVVLGIGQGGNFALALTIIVLRSADVRTAAELSGMSQSVGYTLASFGPLAVGLLRDWTDSWAAVGPFVIVISILVATFGWAAGRNRHVP
jgi:CP family cyanate transporter-like MFS transporter